MRMGHLVVSLIVVVVVALAACGGSDIGASCDEEGKVDNCQSTAVCARNKAGQLVCEKQCTNFGDCPANQECEVVPGFSGLKGCRDK